jgi:hypothetical protein
MVQKPFPLSLPEVDRVAAVLNVRLLDIHRSLGIDIETVTAEVLDQRVVGKGKQSVPHVHRLGILDDAVVEGHRAVAAGCLVGDIDSLPESRRCTFIGGEGGTGGRKGAEHLQVEVGVEPHLDP